MFSGFGHNPYEAEARERWGDEAVDASYQRIRDLAPEQAELARTGFGKVHSGLAELRTERSIRLRQYQLVDGQLARLHVYLQLESVFKQ